MPSKVPVYEPPHEPHMKSHGNSHATVQVLYKYLSTCLISKAKIAMERSRPKNQQMARSSKPNAICKKHPKHQQSPGVCSICLSEKLSQLSKSSRRNKKRVAASACSSSSLSSSPSQCSSCASSSCSSPVYGRMASDRRGPLIFSRAGRDELIKSRSVAAVTQRIREREGMARHEKKKSNFWSKLLRPRGKRTEEAAGLMHARTMREMLAARAH